MEKKEIQKKHGVVHGLARCEDCSWTTESYRNATAIAAVHAKRYGHKVVGEVAYSFEYDGRGTNGEG